jgi:predicted glycoside hydrolase/deacetylase ChbG (UPF0249 family)
VENKISLSTCDLPDIAADDWGFSKGINDGILDLARRDVVRVVSLVANSPHLNYRLEELKRIEGLKFAWHMNFTAGENFPTLPVFIWRWWTGRISPAELTRDARTQIEILKDRVGDKLSEADGHHHVHLVPGVLDTLRPLYQEYGIRFIRLPMEKTHAASFFGSQLIWLQRKKYSDFQLRIYGYPQQRHFKSAQAFRRAASKNRPLLIHPAAYDDFKGNPYGDKLCEERVRQYNFLREVIS